MQKYWLRLILNLVLILILENKMKYIIMALLFSMNSFAIELGSIDSSFSNDGVTDGWDLTDIDDTTHRFNNGDVAVVEGNKIVVASSYTAENGFGDTEYRYRIIRYLSNGEKDSSFAVNGVASFSINAGPRFSEHLSIKETNSGGYLLAFTNLSCPPTPDPDDCFNNITVLHYIDGNPISFLEIGFNLGGSYARQNDVFVGMEFIASMDKAVIVATVDRSNELDTDYGIGVLNIDPTTGALSMDASFGNEGKSTCYFDQGGTESTFLDEATSVVYDSLANTIIVGGWAYESFNQYNMAFCEFEFNGSIAKQWSTQTTGVSISTMEKAHDMQLGNDENGNRALYVAGSIYDRDSMNTSFSLSRFHKDIFGDWQLDTNFANSNTGFITIEIGPFGNGSLWKEPTNLIIENDGSILFSGAYNWFGDNLEQRGAMVLIKFRNNGLLYKSWGSNNTGIIYSHFENDVNDSRLGLEAITQNPITKEIYAVGSEERLSDPSKSLGFITRLHNDGIFGHGFD
jgi:hypothetical protein